jgi:hypothetical protein
MAWRSLVVGVGIAMAGFTTVSAQGAPKGWAFGAAGFFVDWTDEDYGSLEALAGPALQASYLAPRGLGFDARIGWFVENGFYSANGLSGIVGLTYGVPVGRHLFQAKGGGRALLSTGDTTWQPHWIPRRPA